MEGINLRPVADYLVKLFDRVSTKPADMRTIAKAAKFIFQRLGEVPAANFFSNMDKGIKILSGGSVVKKIYNYKWIKEGYTGTAKIAIGVFNFVTAGPLLAHSLKLLSLGKAFLPLSLVSTGLDVVERIVDIAVTTLKLNILFGKESKEYKGHMKEKVATPTRPKRYQTPEAEKARKSKWKDRVREMDMKKYGKFIDVAFYVALLAMHVLLFVSLAIPGVNVVVPLIVVIGLVTAIGLSKLGWSVGTPESKPRKFKHAAPKPVKKTAAAVNKAAPKTKKAESLKFQNVKPSANLNWALA